MAVVVSRHVTTRHVQNQMAFSILDVYQNIQMCGVRNKVTCMYIIEKSFTHSCSKHLFLETNFLLFLSPQKSLDFIDLKLDPCNLQTPCLVIFNHSQISKNLQSKHYHFQTYSKLNSTFTLTFITRGYHSQYKISCHTKVHVYVLLWCFDHKGV